MTNKRILFAGDRGNGHYVLLNFNINLNEIKSISKGEKGIFKPALIYIDTDKAELSIAPADLEKFYEEIRKAVKRYKQQIAEESAINIQDAEAMAANFITGKFQNKKLEHISAHQEDKYVVIRFSIGNDEVAVKLVRAYNLDKKEMKWAVYAYSKQPKNKPDIWIREEKSIKKGSFS